MPGNPSNSPQTQHIKPKVGKNFLTCLGIAAAILLLMLVLALAAVAKTGIVNIPGFSRLYRGPIPTRLVPAEPMTSEAFRVLLSSRFISQALDKKSPPFKAKLSEQELTGALMLGIDQALREELTEPVFAQIVVRPTDLELTLKLERGWLRFDVLARLVPQVKNGEVSFDAVEVQLGDYQLPPSWAYHVASWIFKRDLGAWTLNFGEAKLLDMKLFEGYAEITVGEVGK